MEEEIFKNDLLELAEKLVGTLYIPTLSCGFVGIWLAGFIPLVLKLTMQSRYM